MDRDVDVDADALPARPEIPEDVSSNQSSISDENRLYSSLGDAAQPDLPNEELVVPPSPSDEWPFSQMLVQIAKRISKDELEEIKEMFRGSHGIGKKVREKCDKCITLFGVLRENMYISPSDLLYLTKILYALQRRDLLDILVEYSRNRPNVLHFFEFSEMTEEGYETMKIHVEGPDFRQFKPNSVERLRQVVAKIVCVPAEEVRLAGIEPSSSLLVILLLPEMYIAVLYNLLKRGKDLSELREIDVDVIYLRGQHFILKDSPTHAVSETEQQKKLFNIYEQLREKSKALENSNLQSLKKSKKIEQLMSENEDLQCNMKKQQKLQRCTADHLKLESRCFGLEATIQTLQRMHCIPFSGTKAISDLQKALDDIALEDKSNTQRPLIREVMKCNTELVSSYWMTTNANELRGVEMMIGNKKQTLIALRHKLLTGELIAENWLSRHYSQCIKGRVLRLNKPVVDILKSISNDLNDDERSKLAARYSWGEYDAIKICIEDDKSLFLLGLECKETELTQRQIQTNGFMTLVFKDIGRHDLIQLMQTKIEKRKMQYLQEQTEVQRMDGISSVNMYLSFIWALIEKIAHNYNAKNLFEYSTQTVWE